jgi:hypothetical protein
MARRGKKRALIFYRPRASDLDDEEILEMDSSDGLTIMSRYLMSLNCTPENG